MKNITGEGEEPVVTKWDVLRLLKSNNIHYTPYVIAQKLKIRPADVKELLKPLVESGEVFLIKDTKRTLYRHKCYRLDKGRAVPPQPSIFKSHVCKLREALEEKREGSRLNTQWKSKYF